VAGGARRLVAVAVAVTAAAVVGAACTAGGHREPAKESSPTTAATVPTAEHPRGGSVRVGVWGEPDMGAPTLGGAAVRALVLPQLFVAGPDGRWLPSLVAPGSDRAADAGEKGAVGRLEAKLRDEAVVLPLWRPVTVVAARRGVGGVRANGYGLSPAWNAWEWFRTG
jgi:hypothetical protein